MQKSRTLYAKVGKKFVPVGTEDATVGMYVPGDYIVRVRKRNKTIACCRKNIGLSDARVEVALATARDALARAITRVSEARPNVTRMSPRERRALAAYKRISGNDALTFTRKSACDMAAEAVLVLREQLRTQPRPEKCLEVMAERGL